MIFDGGYVSHKDLLSFLKDLKNEAMTTDELANKLISVGANLSHAAYLNDFSVMERMYSYGVDIDSTNWQGWTALFAAVSLNDLKLAEWLIEKGANVDAREQNGSSALMMAAVRRNVVMLQFLLEHGADPNITSFAIDYTPLFSIYLRTSDPTAIECIELLLQYGAIPQNSTHVPYTIFDFAVMSERNSRSSYSFNWAWTKCLISQIVLLEKVGKTIDRTVMRCNRSSHQEKLAELEGYDKQCEQVLRTVMFQTCSLFDLLTGSDFKIKTYIRDEGFVSKIKETCAEVELEKWYTYYYNTLMRRINKASDLVRLENIAIPIVCGFLNGNENECYIAARKIVGYLNKRGLDRLTEV